MNQQHRPWRHIRNAEYQVSLSTENLCFNKMPRVIPICVQTWEALAGGGGDGEHLLIMEFPYTLAKPWETSMLLGGDLTLNIMQ